MPSSYFEFAFMRLQSGSQVSRLQDWLEKRAMPLFQKAGFGAMGFFNMDVSAYSPAVLGIYSYASLAAMETTWERLHADPEFARALADSEKDDPAVYRLDAMLLRATPFSPPWVPTPADGPAHKVFELRIYESPTHRQLRYLHDRFAGGEIDVFHKSGIYPVLYADTVFGPNRPNMAYLIPFESEAHREQCWAAFRNNPDWVKIRDASIQHGGEIVRNITNMLLMPTKFSMIK